MGIILRTVQNRTIAPTPPPEHMSPLKDVPADIVRLRLELPLTEVEEDTTLDVVTTF